MKMTRLLLAMMLLFHLSAHAQKTFTIQRGTSVLFFSTIDSAITGSADGDILYIPGGNFNIATLTINKGVLMIGAGHYPDSSLATGTTNLTGNIHLVSGASGGGLTGFNLNGDITIGDGSASSDSVSNYSITRCNFNDIYFSVNGLPPTFAKIFSVSENVIRGNIYGANATNISFTKNIISGSINTFNGSVTFSNNDFIGLGNCTTLLTLINDVSSATFENNIVLFTSPVCPGGAFFSGLSNSNVFSYNMFVQPLTFPLGTNTGFSNINNQPVPTIFLSAAGDIFNYADNYNLQSNSPGNNAGTDSHDIGIYGTSVPYKDGALPFNPHILQKLVAPNTSTQGFLNIQIDVEAQDH